MMRQAAFLGAGAMGARMARTLLEAGVAVRVWNRTPERLAPLVEAGATAAPTPRAAVEGAEAAFSMLRDDAASERVWLDPEDGALVGLGEQAIGVECSTLSLDHVRRLASAFERRRRGFLDAPVAGSRPQAEARQLIFLVGGRPETVAAARPLLEIMGAAVHHAGESGAGAAVKLTVNALFGVQLATVAELIGLARKRGLDAATAVEILGATPVASPAAKGAAQAMLAGGFAPAFPIDLVAKDFGLVMDAAASAESAAPMSAAARAVYETAVAQGHGGDNITGVAQLYWRD